MAKVITAMRGCMRCEFARDSGSRSGTIRCGHAMLENAVATLYDYASYVETAWCPCFFVLINSVLSLIPTYLAFRVTFSQVLFRTRSLSLLIGSVKFRPLIHSIPTLVSRYFCVSLARSGRCFLFRLSELAFSGDESWHLRNTRSLAAPSSSSPWTALSKEGVVRACIFRYYQTLCRAWSTGRRTGDPHTLLDWHVRQLVSIRTETETLREAGSALLPNSCAIPMAAPYKATISLCSAQRLDTLEALLHPQAHHCPRLVCRLEYTMEVKPRTRTRTGLDMTGTATELIRDCNRLIFCCFAGPESARSGHDRGVLHVMYHCVTAAYGKCVVQGGERSTWIAS